MLEQTYYSLDKTAMAKGLLTAGLVGAGLGGLYGIGDSKTNYRNEVFKAPVASRSAQGAASGLAGALGYNLARSSGRGRLLSGLIGLLSTGGVAALTNPEIKKDPLYNLPF